MRCNTINLPFQNGMSYRLYTLADVHAGNANACLDKVEDLVQEVADDPMGLLSINGDMGDFITYTDARFDPATVDSNLIRSLADLQVLPKIYTDYLTDLLYPVRDKIICVTTGKHDADVEKKFATNPLWEVCRNLDIMDRWGDWACMTTLRFTDETKHSDSFDIFQSHGWQASRKGGAITNNLDDMMGWVQCDILLQAHSHQYIIKHKVVLYVENGNVEQKTCIGAHTGGWLLTYKQVKGGNQTRASYAERAGYPPTVIGSPKFTITPSAYGHGSVSA
jgi:hypothetical protein